jgi:DNA-binding NarL/FixJ family response regulator
MAARVLVVDDHPLTREALAALLRSHGFELAGLTRSRISSCSTS